MGEGKSESAQFLKVTMPEDTKAPSFNEKAIGKNNWIAANNKNTITVLLACGCILIIAEKII